jgi:5-methylcytosine-specific restriction endonuclease McrA
VTKIIWGIDIPIKSKHIVGWNNHENPNWYEDCLINTKYEDYIKIIPEMSFRLCDECGTQLVGRRKVYNTCSPEHNKKKWERLRENERSTNLRHPFYWVTFRYECFERDGKRCRWCGQPHYQNFFDYSDITGEKIRGISLETKLHAHHIKPIKDGGYNTLDNLITLCEDCHKKEHSSANNTKRKHVSLDVWLG